MEYDGPEPEGYEPLAFDENEWKDVMLAAQSAPKYWRREKVFVHDNPQEMKDAYVDLIDNELPKLGTDVDFEFRKNRDNALPRIKMLIKKYLIVNGEKNNKEMCETFNKYYSSKLMFVVASMVEKSQFPHQDMDKYNNSMSRFRLWEKIMITLSEIFVNIAYACDKRYGDHASRAVNIIEYRLSILRSKNSDYDSRSETITRIVKEEVAKGQGGLVVERLPEILQKHFGQHFSCISWKTKRPDQCQAAIPIDYKDNTVIVETDQFTFLIHRHQNAIHNEKDKIVTETREKCKKYFESLRKEELHAPKVEEVVVELCPQPDHFSVCFLYASSKYARGDKPEWENREESKQTLAHTKGIENNLHFEAAAVKVLANDENEFYARYRNHFYEFYTFF